MLLLGSDLLNLPILSLQTGKELARTKESVIDPYKLLVIGYQLSGHSLDNPQDSFLRMEDVREMSNSGIIIDAHDEIVSKKDVLKLSQILDLNFSLLGLSVYTKDNKKLGTVIDYSVDSTFFSVEQIIVKRPFFKSLTDTQLVISRRDIIKLDNQKITVKSEKQKLENLEEIAISNSTFVNPFKTTNQSLSTDKESLTS